jgi:hypothetical protein
VEYNIRSMSKMLQGEVMSLARTGARQRAEHAEEKLAERERELELVKRELELAKGELGLAKKDAEAKLRLLGLQADTARRQEKRLDADREHLTRLTDRLVEQSGVIASLRRERSPAAARSQTPLRCLGLGVAARPAVK